MKVLNSYGRLGRPISNGVKKKIILCFVGIMALVLLSTGSLFAYTVSSAGVDDWAMTSTPSLAELNPTWSFDCTKLAYYELNPSGGACNVKIIPNANTSSPGTATTITTGSLADIAYSDGGLSFTLDGTKIVFGITSASTSKRELWIANVDGSSPVRLLGDSTTTDYCGANIGWQQPDGEERVIYEERPTAAAPNIKCAVLSGTSLGTSQNITNFSSGDSGCLFPRWAPTGTKICFLRGFMGGTAGDVYILNNVQDHIGSPITAWTDGDLTQVTDNYTGVPATEKMACMPAFSYDGNYLFYAETDVAGTFDADNMQSNPMTAFDGVDFDMHIYNINTLADTKYNDQAWNQCYLGMSPDGMWMTYMQQTGSGNPPDIYISAPKPETDSLGSTAGTAGSLDGSEIVVPSGALSSDTTLSIYKPRLSAAQEAGTPFCVRSFAPTGSFLTAVDITIHYTDKELGGYSEGSLYIVKWNSSTSAWERETGTITRDTTNNKITIPVDSFSDYGVEGSTTAADDDDEWYKCAIATASYGTPMAEEVKALSTFRDEYLLTNRPGQILVSTYERISPSVADFIRDKESLKAIVRIGLKPLVWGAEKVTQ